MRHKQSDYMHWAKTQQRARHNLATSGVGSVPLQELNFDPARLELFGDNAYGYRPLQAAIGAHLDVDPDCVVPAAGCSMANHLAMSAILEPGDEVLMEQPVYGPILDVALYLGAEVKRFQRREEDGFAVDPAEVRKAISPRTRLIVLTNLHNPSSVLTSDATLREIGNLARSAGALVLVDEVYLDSVYENTPRTSFHLGPEFVVTSSLTKIYGVSGIRCGWILARPDLAWRMRRLDNIFSATPVHPAEILGVAAFERLDFLRERARRVVDRDRETLGRWLAENGDRISAPRTDWGTTCFLRILGATDDSLPDRLRAEYETSVVPGGFFEMPGRVRIGMGVDSEMFAEGLRRISQCVIQEGRWRSRN